MRQKFINSIRFNNRATHTLKSIEFQIKTAENFMKKPLEVSTLDDIQAYIEYLKEEGWSESSIGLAKAKLKQFYLFCFEETEDIKYRKLAKALKGKIHTKAISPQELLNSDDIQRLLNIAGIEQDRCLVAVLWESGMRVGELMALTNKMVQMNEKDQEVIFHIPDMQGCKTGRRTVPCVEIYGYVESWLKCQTNPSADANFIQMGYMAILGRLEKLFQRAGLDKPCNPHIFRHSAITHAVNLGMQQNAISARFWGHVDSNMLKVYISLSEQMQADAYKRAKGMNGGEVKVINPLASRCIVCGRLIQSGNKCSSCSDIEALRELVHMQQKQIDELKRFNGEILAELHS
jgi:site-specific recombinase XerD